MCAKLKKICWKPTMHNKVSHMLRNVIMDAFERARLRKGYDTSSK